MTRIYDLLLMNGQVLCPWGLVETNIAVKEGYIAELGDPPQGKAHEVIDCTGLVILPGVIDTQVHFREPGQEHKEDLESGSRAAVMGGVTALFEMPNTNPPTTTRQRLQEKLDLAHGRMWCDHAFYIGASADNIDELADLELMAGCCGIKLFMGSSTGSLLVDDDEALDGLFKSGRRRIAIHAEDNARLESRKNLTIEGHPQTHPIWRDTISALAATHRAIKLARQHNRLVHILHVSTEEEMKFLAQHKDIATVEATPQHLIMSAPDCYDRLGTLAQMNPPIRSEQNRQGLWQWLHQGVVDIVATDHAPHTLEEKQALYPNSPSGMPGVQTLLPLMLNAVHQNQISLVHMVELISAAPARVFGIEGAGRIVVGARANFSVVDLNSKFTIEEDWLASRCGWSPFTGTEVTGKPIGTVIRGHRVMWDGAVIGTPIGDPISFLDTRL